MALWYMGITLGCLPGERGSSPRRVAIFLESSSVGRATVFGIVGRRFESYLSSQNKSEYSAVW